MNDALFLEFQSALAGRYALERELGRGGMGIVYLARVRREGALKPHEAARILREVAWAPSARWRRYDWTCCGFTAAWARWTG